MSSEPSTTIILIPPPEYKSAVEWIQPTIEQEEYVKLKSVAPDYISEIRSLQPAGSTVTSVELWDWVSAYAHSVCLERPFPVLHD